MDSEAEQIDKRKYYWSNMKTLRLSFLSPILVIVLIVGCQDEIESPYFDTVICLDTTLMIESGYYTSHTNSLSLDIDYDGQLDITFSIFEDPSYSNYIRIHYVEVHNGYELAVQNSYKITESNANEFQTVNYDSSKVEIPAIFGLSDTITLGQSYKTGKIELAYYNHEVILSYDRYVYTSDWVNIKEGYIGLRNMTLNQMGWIKIEIDIYSKLLIHSHFNTLNKDLLIVKD